MGIIKESEKVKLIIGVITGFTILFGKVKERLSAQFGIIDCESDIFPFNFTNYYEAQMGKNLQRKFFSFEKLISPSDLAEIKVWTNKLEEVFSASKEYPAERPINIDPGYIALSRFILASAKDFSHRIHLQKGIYAEVTLIYRNDAFQPLEWTFPDYRTSGYLNFFDTVRNIYHQQLRNL